jgi:hypothetical protein
MAIADRTAAEPVAALTLAQRHELEEAGRRTKAIRRAAGVAAFNGWSMAILAVLSAPFAISSFVSVVIAAGLGVLAWNELRGRRQLLAFDPQAPALLGWNQLALLALVGGYCLFQIAMTLFGESQVAKEFAAHPELREVLGSGEEFEAMLRPLVVMFYGLVIVISVAAQGLNAWYYFSRRKHVEAYLRETPAWVVELQRLTGRA